MYSLYNAASASIRIWQETWTATSTKVSTVNGVFSVPLGSLGQQDLSAVDWNSSSIYLQVDLDPNCTASSLSWTENFSIRKQLTSSPYAFNADMIDGIHATSTAAVANQLLALDAGGNLNLLGKGVSSTVATTTEFVHIGTDDGNSVKNLDRRGGDLHVSGDAEFDGTVYLQGAVISSNNPTQPHGFGAWSQGVAGSNVNNSVFYINPSSAVADSNLLGLAVNGSVQFIVDAEGDVFANSLTLSGSQSVSQSTISTLIVENNSYLGDAPNSDWTHIKGTAWIESNKSSVASSTALTITQQGTGNLLEVSDGSSYYGRNRYFTINNSGVASSTELVVVNSARLSVVNATTTNVDILTVYGGATFNAVTTTDSLFVGGYASSTGGLYSRR